MLCPATLWNENATHVYLKVDTVQGTAVDVKLTDTALLSVRFQRDGNSYGFDLNLFNDVASVDHSMTARGEAKVTVQKVVPKVWNRLVAEGKPPQMFKYDWTDCPEPTFSDTSEDDSDDEFDL